MHRARATIEKISVSELTTLLLGEPYAPKEILEENRLIHHRLGFTGDEEYSIVVGGIECLIGQKSMNLKHSASMLDRPLLLVFRPDAVRDGVVYELKVLRRYSNRESLMLQGYLQLQLELYALGFEHGRLLVYRLDDGRVEEYDVVLDHGLVEEVLNIYLMFEDGRARLSRLLRDRCKALRHR